MQSQRKWILYAVASLLLVFIVVKAVHAISPVVAKARLKSRIAKLEPWTATTNYSAGGWKQLIKTARAFQQADPKIADAALEAYFKNVGGDPVRLDAEQGKAFLLFRVIFDIPENAPQRIPGPLWERGFSDINPDGTVNQAWPIRWNGGQPQLVAGRQGVAGGAYSPRNEYSFMRFRHKSRDLSKTE